MPATLRRVAIAGIALLFIIPTVATAAPAEAPPGVDTRVKGAPTARPSTKAKPVKAQPTRAGSAELGGGGRSTDFRRLAMTWHSNEASSKDRAIYHCVRQGEIVGPAYVVDRADAVRFSCRFDKRVDWPYGVVVFQPAGRRVVVKVGASVVEAYDPRAEGDDVWVVKGNPTGWWRTFIS